MSLSALLLRAQGSGDEKVGGSERQKSLDKDLDAVFKSTVPTRQTRPKPQGYTIPTSSVAEKKRKLATNEGRATAAHDGSKSKKRRLSVKSESFPEEQKLRGNSKGMTGETQRHEEKGKTRQESNFDDGEGNAELEGKYFHSRQSAAEPSPTPSDNFVNDESDEEGDPFQLVHESLEKEEAKGSRSSKQIKYVPPEETPERRDERTIFVGNIPIEVAKSKSLLKQLKKYILSCVPLARIESTRFRSVAFQNPTSKLRTSDDEDDVKFKPKSRSSAKDKTRQHDRERTATWRETKEDEDVEKDKKKYLTPEDKKKVAFIKKDFNSNAEAVNCYIVFAHRVPSGSRETTTPLIADPYEAARQAVEKCDGTVFMEHTLRVDRVGEARQKDGVAADGDPKMTVFVGNLDFASREEDVRAFFEGVVSAERGPPGGEADDEDRKPKRWVQRVRIVRDRETQLGKGFAYVQFSDRECVDEVLALEESKLKFSQRKLRVQRCKTIPGGPSVPSSSSSRSKAETQIPHRKHGASNATQHRTHGASNTPKVPPVPKGNPALGEQLSGLSKAERKMAKAQDVDRVARRLAKKKAKGALQAAGVQGEKVRKRPKAKAGSAGEAKKKRVRSDKSMLKKNTKKS